MISLPFWTETPALLKVIAFFVAWGCGWLPIVIPLGLALKWRPPHPLTEAQKLPLLASLYLIAPLILWAATEVEGVSFSDYGLKWQPQLFISVAIGLGFSTLSLILLWGLQWGLGWIQLRQPDSIHTVVSPPPMTPGEGEKPLSPSPAANGFTRWQSLSILLLGLWVSGTEETIFRGFLPTQLQQDYSLVIAAVIASGIFAVTHLIWDIRGYWPQLPGLWLMGMVLVFARICDHGNLGLAIGLHSGWIWGIASFDTAKRFIYTNRVPSWVTGMEGKPLAGIVGMILLLVTATALLIY